MIPSTEKIPVMRSERMSEIYRFIREHSPVEQRTVRKQFIRTITESYMIRILNDFEHSGVIQRIKHGRSNTIVLVKDKKNKKVA